MTQSDQHVFEREVRRLAGLIWGVAGNQTAHNGRQIDGRFSTPDTVHYLEATTSKSSSNTRDNANKLAETIIAERKRDTEREHRGWIVLLHDASPEQTAALREVIQRKHNAVRIDMVSFDRFRSRLIDASHYLELRGNAPFGSAEDPTNDSTTIAIPYVRLGIYDVRESCSIEIAALFAQLRANDLFYSAEAEVVAPRIALLGEYGAGKSMTLRELFLRLRSAYYEGRSFRFPVMLNMRDHHGQEDPIEAIERHARRIGFDHPSHLVRAWRAGHTVLLLDGFDELAPAGWAQRNISLKTFRHASVTLIREFMAQTPPGSPVLVAGRRSFFDSEHEMCEALGLPAMCRQYRLDEFTNDQVAEFLKHLGWSQRIPEWLPRRPLLLGFLARRQLLSEVILADAGPDEAFAWDSLIDRICDREAKIDAQLHGTLVRQIAERLATIARRDLRGLGPLHQRELESVFREICGFDPTDKGLQLLYRFFCLGPARDADGAREFVDEQLADALRAGDVHAYVQNLVRSDQLAPGVWQAPLQSLGLGVLLGRLSKAGVTSKQLAAACDRAASARECDALLAELVVAASMSGLVLEEPYEIAGANCPDLSVYPDSGRIPKVTFRGCVFDMVSLDPAASSDQVPYLIGCAIDTMEGPTSVRDAPGGKIDPTTTVERFADSADANARVRSLPLPLGRRVLVTVLRKLFLQRGSGRRANAFVRGLSDEERMLVPEVLEIVRKHDFAVVMKHRGEAVWHPLRTRATQARDCIARPSQSSDAIMLEADKLG